MASANLWSSPSFVVCSLTKVLLLLTLLASSSWGWVGSSSWGGVTTSRLGDGEARQTLDSRDTRPTLEPGDWSWKASSEGGLIVSTLGETSSTLGDLRSSEVVRSWSSTTRREEEKVSTSTLSCSSSIPPSTELLPPVTSSTATWWERQCLTL